MRVKEWPNSKMIPRAEEAPARSIPDCKSEISKQVLDTVFAPRTIGSKQQFNVGHSRLNVFATCSELRHEIRPRVHARVSNYPNKTVKGEGLVFLSRLFGGPEQRMAKADVTVHPNLLRVRAAKGHETSHSCKKRGIHRSAVLIQDADDSAHCEPISIEP